MINYVDVAFNSPPVFPWTSINQNRSTVMSWKVLDVIQEMFHTSFKNAGKLKVLNSAHIFWSRSFSNQSSHELNFNKNFSILVSWLVNAFVLETMKTSQTKSSYLGDYNNILNCS